MPKIDLSMLNQRQTPAFYADVLANRPAAGFIGRIFVSTNTYAFYRDNGTGWDLIGGPGTGTVTGSGTAGQVTYWDGASSITGSNNLFWDSAAGHLGINNNTPGTGLDVHDSQSTILQLNQTTATNDTRIAFQNGGTSLWRIGNFYNAGANDWGIYDVVGAAQRLTVKKTSGQVLIGTSTVGSGKLVVASASSDNGIQIVGASAPSLRIDSAESGPTKRAGLGISTATNNFIQGSADRDFCIFNGSTAAASPILFGVYDAGAVNVQEAARISAARNLLINTTTDNGQKLQVNGSSLISGAASFTNTVTISPSYGGTATNDFLIVQRTGGAVGLAIGYDNVATQMYLGTNTNHSLQFRTNNTTALTLNTSGNLQLGTTSGGNWRFLCYQNASTGESTSSSLMVRQDGTDDIAQFWLGGSNIASIKSTGNLLIGTTTDNGRKLQVNGVAYVSSNICVNTNTIDAGTAIFNIGVTGLTRGDLIGTIFNSATYGTTLHNASGGTSPNAALAIFKVGNDGTTGRSINASGTINAAGLDYAEYMTKAIQETIEKGDIVGIDANGMLTNIFTDAISFVVKSTNPSYVGGDNWGSNLKDDQLEEERQKFDRIAFSGQIPCNVYNANVGDYIIPVNIDNKISGVPVSNPTFEQYQISVGKVWKILEDGRAWIAVKIG